jgi:hypothetical protein
VRQLVWYSSGGKSALNMKFSVEPSLRQQLPVYTPIGITRNFGKEVRPATAALGTRSRPQGKSAGFAARYNNCGRWVKGNRIGAAMNGLAIVAMTDVLRHGFADQLRFDGTATTSNTGTCH